MRSAATRITTRAALERLTFGSLDWPGKTTRLDPDSVDAYLQRASTAGSSLAELYHVNTGLTRAAVPRLLAAQTDPVVLCRAVVRRTAATSWEASEDANPVPAWLEQLTGALVEALVLEDFFAVEVRLLLEGGLHMLEPVARRWQLLGEPAPADLALARAAIRLLPSAGELSEADAVLVLVGRFGRYDALYGTRGYRRTLVEAGRIAQAILTAARQYRVGARAVTEFADVELNAVALADGVEEACLVAIELEGPAR